MIKTIEDFLKMKDLKKLSKQILIQNFMKL